MITVNLYSEPPFVKSRAGYDVMPITLRFDDPKDVDDIIDLAREQGLFITINFTEIEDR